MTQKLIRPGRLFDTRFSAGVALSTLLLFVSFAIPIMMAGQASADTPRDITGSRRDLYKTQGGSPIYALEKRYADRCNPNTYISYVMCGRDLNKALVVAARDEGAVGHLFLCMDQSNFYDDGAVSQVVKFSPCVAHGEIEFSAEHGRLIGFELRDKAAMDELCRQAVAYYKRHKKCQRDMGMRNTPSYEQLVRELNKER